MFQDDAGRMNPGRTIDRSESMVTVTRRWIYRNAVATRVDQVPPFEVKKEILVQWQTIITKGSKP